MANNQTRVNGETSNTRFDITHHETDSPLLPVAQIERLQQFAPDRVDWVFEQTAAEATHRRSHTSRMALMVFVERILGLLAAFGLCGLALYLSYLVALAGHDWASVAIGSTAAASIAGAFLINRRK